MFRVWSLILIICVLTRISQTDPMEPGRVTGKSPPAGEEEKSKKSTTTGTYGDLTKPLLSTSGESTEVSSGAPKSETASLTEDFTFPRAGEGAGYTRLKDKKLEKPKELSGLQRPLLGEETDPPTETTSEMPRRRAGKAPVKEDSPEPITASYEKLEQTKDGTAICRLGFFYPATEDGEIEEKECGVHCKTHFGKIVSSTGDSIDIAVPGIYKGQICRCIFNYGGLKDYITNRLSEKDFDDFFNLACDDGFCAARVWLKDNKFKVKIEYEMEAKKQKSPVTASTLVTPQKSTTNTPDRSPPQTRTQTPSRTPSRTPFQSPSRTPDRFSMQTSKDSGGVNKSKGVAKSSTGTATAPGTPHRSPMRTAPGTPDRLFTGGDTSTYTDDVYLMTPPEEVLVGAFTTPDGSFTLEMCAHSCRTAFGKILSPESAYTVRMPFTKAKLTADGKTCNCMLRSIVPQFCYDNKSIRYDMLVKKITKYFFCAGKVYIESSTTPKTNIEIEYERAARPPHKNNKDNKNPNVRISVPGRDEQHENPGPGFDGVGEPSIIMGTFDKGVWKKKITHDMCQQKCNEYFGYIYLNDTYKTHFTIGELNIDWHKCKCFVNVEPIKEKIDERLARRNYNWIEFSESCKTKNGYFTVIDFLITHEEYGLKIEPGNALTAEERQRLRQSKRRVDAKQKRALRMAIHRKEKKLFRSIQYKLGECEVYCNTRFGFVAGYPTRVPFTKPELSEDKYNCECWLNTKPLFYFLIVPVRNVEWDEFFDACEYSYERGVRFLRNGGPDVPVRGGVKKKSPRIDVVDINGNLIILPGDPPIGGGPSSSETPVPDVPSNPTVI